MRPQLVLRSVAFLIGVAGIAYALYHRTDAYAVSMFGERSPWVGNVRAAGGRAVLRRGGRRGVRLVEVPVADQAPILRAYLARAAGARPHIRVDRGAPLEAFERVAPELPVFRIDEGPA